LSFPSLGLQPAPIEFSLSIFVLAPLFHARFSRWRLVSREPILGLSVELLALPRLISLAPDLSPVHASLVRWSEWLPILFVCADPIWILCLIIFFVPCQGHGFASTFCRSWISCSPCLSWSPELARSVFSGAHELFSRFFKRVDFGADFLWILVWIVAGSRLSLFLNYQMEKLEVSWSKLLSCGDFLDAHVRCSVKCM
jgi:hypothetical protein